MTPPNPVTAEVLTELITTQARITEIRGLVHDRVVELIEAGKVTDAAGQTVEHTFADGRCCGGYGRLEISVATGEAGIEARVVHVLDDARGPSSRSRTMVVPAALLTGETETEERYRTYVALREEFGDR